MYAASPPYWFWMDLVGTVPWDLLTSGDGGGDGTARAAGMLKLPRLLRLSRLMKKLEVLRAGNVLTVARLLIYFFLFSHWVACVWWLLGEARFNTMADFGTSWTMRGFLAPTLCAPLDPTEANRQRASLALAARAGVEPGYGNATAPQREILEVLEENWVHAWCEPMPAVPGGPLAPSPANLLTLDFGQQYLSSLYWSLTLLMKTAHIGPDTAYEKLFATVMVFVGSLVYIVMLASVVSMLTAYSKTNAIHRDHVQTVTQFCNARRLASGMRRRWFQYINEEYRRTHGFSDASVLQSFPYHLRTNTMYAIYGVALKACPLFRGLEQVVLKELLAYLKHELILAKTVLIQEGQPSSRLYILCNGVLHAVHSKSGGPAPPPPRDSRYTRASAAMHSAEPGRSSTGRSTRATRTTAVRFDSGTVQVRAACRARHSPPADRSDARAHPPLVRASPAPSPPRAEGGTQVGRDAHQPPHSDRTDGARVRLARLAQQPRLGRTRQRGRD
jgi:hypothetical protein